MPLVDEGRQDALRQRGRAAREQHAQAAETGCLFFRHHQVSQPHAGKQHLAERAGIQHPPLPVQALQGGQRPADVAVFAVVVIFDDPGVAALGPVQQRLPARQRQRQAERALMRGRDHGRAGARFGGKARVHHHPLFVHAHGHGLHARLRQQRARGRIAGVFHPYRVARLEQRMQDELHRVVVARRNEHLRCGALDAARHLQVGRGGGPQR
ncbi:hypothetical protein D3C72_1589100 [compost metagenome]